MSSFTSPLVVEILREQHEGRTLAKVVTEFEYFDDDALDYRYTIKVPVGFVTDFASIPRFFWVLLPPLGKYAKAAVIHDFMVKNKILDYKVAANMFYNGMLVLEVPEWKANLMATAVHQFGPRW